jgi:hypothetical protein
VARIVRAITRAALITGSCTIVACVTATPSGSGPGTHAEDELRSVERQRLRALVTADIATLKRLHAEDFQAISPFGYAFARGEYLQRVGSGELDYVRWEPEDIHVRLYGAVAAIRYKARADVTSRGKLLPTMRTWNTAYYERRKGRWVIVWFQVTQISPLQR